MLQSSNQKANHVGSGLESAEMTGPTRSSRGCVFGVRRSRPRRGAMMVLIVVILVGFFVTVVFSVGMAQMQLSRTEALTVAEAASRAAALQLDLTGDTELAMQQGQQVAGLNQVNGQPAELTRADFEFGRQENDSQGRVVFVPGRENPNAVRVTYEADAPKFSEAIVSKLAAMIGIENWTRRAAIAD